MNCTRLSVKKTNKPTGGIIINIFKDLNKDIDVKLFSKENMNILSFILIVFTAAVIPLIVFPRVVCGLVALAYSLDHTGYYKMVFVNIIGIFMLTIMLFNYRSTHRSFKFNIPLLLFTLWAGVSTIFSENLLIAFMGYPTRWQGLITHISYFIIFTYSMNMLNFKYVKSVIKFVFISASIISVYSVINFYGFDPINIPLRAFLDSHINPVVVRATLGNRNTGGAYFSLLMPISLFLYLKSETKKQKIIYYFSTVLFFLGIVASLTRVSWIGTSLMCILSLWFLRKNIKKYFKKIGIVLVTFFFIVIVLDISGGGQISGRHVDFLRQVKDVQSNGNIEKLGSNRMFIYKRALTAIKEHPIVGIGPESFIYYGRTTLEESKGLSLNNKVFFDKAHSDYLEFAATMGIPSLVFYIWFILSIFIPLIKREKNIPPHILALFIGWMAYLVQQTFNLNTISVSPVFFVFSAILYKYLICVKDEVVMDEGSLKTIENEEVDKIALT